MSRTYSIKDDESRVLQDLIIYLVEEANKCASAQAYFAACVMLGAALEAMLLAMVSMFPEEVEKVISMEKFRERLGIQEIRDFGVFIICLLFLLKRGGSHLKVSMIPIKENWAIGF